VAGVTADDIVRLFEGDVRARKRLAELLVSEPDIRLAIINAVMRDVATKHDLKELEGRLEARIGSVEARLMGVERELAALRERIAKVEGALTQLAERIGDLDKRIDSLDKRIDALDKRIDSLDMRIDSLDKRMDSLDKRMDYIARLTLVLTGSVVAALAASIILGILGG